MTRWACYDLGMFIDRARIMVFAGKGGDGKVAFRRAKGLPKGGPNGGDGGKGGDVILRVDEGLNTLVDFRGIYEWKAQEGEGGGKKQCTGGDGEDLVIRVPAGTVVYNEETGDELADLGPGDSVVIAKGGRGGFGNEHFKNAVNQTPRQATPGEPGEAIPLRLELKVIAEVGLVGLPNAGKSTFLKSVTRAEPKIADYPFTTLSPQLGIATLDGARRLVIADIPGLIEGASGGAGLGHDFLRHIERTKVIVHVLDVEPDNGLSAAKNYRAIRAELRGYSSELAEKPELIALNKMDLMTDEDQKEAMDAMRTELQLDAATEIYPISGATGVGCAALLEAVYRMLHRDRVESGW